MVQTEPGPEPSPPTFPVAVDPVKEILATLGSVQRTCPTAGALSLEQGTTLTTPGGTPARSASCKQQTDQNREQRTRSSGGV